ncbi:hypothetical protein O3P69_016923 [Scylla paramamosain]|uniref:Uncharacterized protein n=1 Tax=Scylla paramamosain TaxID=85552 RepID=A0AAW0TT56_SCYPA
MALLHLSHLYRSVGMQRQVLQKWQPLMYGGARWCSEAAKDVVPAAQQRGDKGPNNLGRLGEETYVMFARHCMGLVMFFQDALERARNKARIKINIMMCVATLLGCFAMIYSGKKARDAGESVVKTNLDWHKKINEEYKKEQEGQ